MARRPPPDEVRLKDDAEGIKDIIRAWGRGLSPDPDLTVSEWADQYRILSSRASSEAGQYRTSRTPYMKAIMDALSPQHPALKIVFQKGAQVGATEAGNNWMGYCIHQAPGPFLAVQPTTDLAKRLSQQRIEPLIEESPELRALILPARSRDAGNTVLAKRFPGGQLILTGANSAVGLRSMPVRWLFLDEVDAYDQDVDGEGDPISLAEARTRTFGHRRKVFMASTPTVRYHSRIEREYLASDQQRYFLPCPRCGFPQWLKFERLRWEKGEPLTARYHCENCNAPIQEHNKTLMLEAGIWQPTNPDAVDPLTIGFHISGLYSPVGWLSWAQVAQEWEAAQGNDAMLKVAKNTLLGETWQESGEAPEWQVVYERREHWQPGTVPMEGLFLSAGGDVQKDRIEVDVWAWGRAMESWLIDHIVLEGGPDQPETWEQLDDLLLRKWTHESGVEMGITRLAIDTGYGSATVYDWARHAGFGLVAPVKGMEGFNRSAPVSGPTYVDATQGGKRLRRGARLWTVSVSTFKAETYRFLRLPRPTDEDRAAGVTFAAGTIHLPDWLDSEWVKQLVAEQLMSVKNKRGFVRLEWEKIRERNEALDCRVYARAAAWIVGADRMTEARWRELEEQFVTDRPPADRVARSTEAAVTAARQVAPTRAVPARRISRSSYMS